MAFVLDGKGKSDENMSYDPSKIIYINVNFKHEPKYNNKNRICTGIVYQIML